MKEGRFREDLYYRLNVVTVNLPSLRERRRDIPLLIEHLLAKYAAELGERGVAPEALDRLVGYDWPGNVRELENVIQRAMVMATSGIILPEHLPIGPVSAAASATVDAPIEEIIERKLDRVRPRPARARQRQSLRPDDRPGREAAAARGAA